MANMYPPMSLGACSAKVDAGFPARTCANVASLDARPTRVDHPSVDALLEENKQLKELVVQLSEIVLMSVLDRSH